MANTMTIEEARSIVTEHSGQDLSMVIEMQDDFVMSLAKGYLKALATKPATGSRGPTMQDKVESALREVGAAVTTAELFEYMLESGLAHEGQYKCMQSALTVGKNKAGRPFFNQNGRWMLLDEATQKKMDLLAKLEALDVDALEALTK